jgi:hypothetical protein
MIMLIRNTVYGSMFQLYYGHLQVNHYYKNVYILKLYKIVYIYVLY